MEPIKIYVSDSYHTDLIVEVLENYFGEKVECHTDLKEADVFDIFFLSGRHILHNLNLNSLKRNFGYENTKVVAVSATDVYLVEIRNTPSLGVDFTMDKQLFFANSINLEFGEALDKSFTVKLDEIFSSVR